MSSLAKLANSVDVAIDLANGCLVTGVGSIELVEGWHKVSYEGSYVGRASDHRSALLLLAGCLPRVIRGGRQRFNGLHGSKPRAKPV